MNVWVSRHAAERFQERMRPTLTVRQASIELARLCREHSRRCSGPPWKHNQSTPDFWLSIGDDCYVACAAARPGRWPTALTVLTKSLAPLTRERRNERRRNGASAREKTRADRHRPSGRRTWAPSIDVLED